MSKEAMTLALDALELNRRTHYYCEDTWYSCPKHEDGCANEAEGDECNCGADQINAQIDNAITAIREALAEQPAQQEPVAWEYCEEIYAESNPELNDYIRANGIPLYTSPPAQRKWVGLTDEQPSRWAVFCGICRKQWSVSYQHPGKSVCDDCEAAHGIKENT